MYAGAARAARGTQRGQRERRPRLAAGSTIDARVAPDRGRQGLVSASHDLQATDPKIAVVVGGGSGLGAATARRFDAAGWRLVVVDRDLAAAQRVADTLAHGRAVGADATNDADVCTAFDMATNSGDMRAVICCAGVGHAERLLNRSGAHDPASFKRVIDINLVGSFHVLRHAARAMATNEPDEHGQRGVCVLTASIASEDGQVGQLAYAASKAGVAGMTLSAARDLSGVGIRVCTISPGVFATPLFEGLPQPAQDRLLEDVPFPSRGGDPSEFAALVEHLVANPMLNGAVFRIDGSLRMPYVRPRGTTAN
jgi:NAD(P)-dependent dehydrogenase (short-subunit alcohol dehydrogenase family)